jgi:hypothetical protein
VYQFRELNSDKEVTKFVFDLDRETALNLYWGSTAFTVQLLEERRVIIQRSWEGLMDA